MKQPKRLRPLAAWEQLKKTATSALRGLALRIPGRQKIVPLLRQKGEWLRLKSRRVFLLCHEMVAGRRYAAPLSFLSASCLVGVVMICTTLYSVSYAVYIDGENVGTVDSRDTVTAAISSVEESSRSLLGYDYTIDNEITYRVGVSRRSSLDDQAVFVDYFSANMDSGEDEGLRQYEVLVGGQFVGIIDSKSAFNAILQDIRNAYVNENTISAEFVEEIELNPVFASAHVVDAEEMRRLLTESTSGETTYTVAKGDTFGGIAYRNDMSVSELKALNPGININKLSIGQVLNVRELIPRLSVRTTEHTTYLEAIECPVVTQDDASIYVGSSKILVKGVEGQAEVTADISYVNGVEKDRTVLNYTTLSEPTTTIKAVGTKPKPKTASNGYYKWPCSGKITSYFGYRKIFGSRSYHSGIDIAGSYGTSIKAADGGKVTFAGYKGAYGYLVIITHDNGTQTYYGHNSSNLVSVGQRVYQGQVIAKMGSTGRSTGNHCHFEVRIRGSAVNPLNYLP
ncbi:MAG: M23 family metallopeptidase [Ruminococcaceae bacterium]|nr:M23 family metallopeptidase [Oscillospiraceae bacterium]